MVKKEKIPWIDLIPSSISFLLFILQIIIGFYLLSYVSQIEILAYLGVALYVFSGIIFGMLPVFEFRKKGGVKKGKSYIHTNKVVDSGIYSIVRHPQYITFIMFAIAGMLLFQHWIIILLGIPIIPLIYIDLKTADEDAIKKFGDDYKKYMKKVPRSNFLIGIFRIIKNKK